MINNRRWVGGGWAQFCLHCWHKRGSPSWTEALEIVEKEKAEKKAEEDRKHQELVDRGEVPW